MRDELELIEKIDQYLAGKLSQDEAQAFEQQISSNASLQKAVSTQHDIIQGISQIAIKKDVQHAGSQYYSGRQFAH